MINANAFGYTYGFGAMPRFDPSAVANVPASTYGPTEQPLSTASTYSGLPLRMQVQASDIVSPITGRRITAARPASQSDIPRTNPPGGDDIDLNGGAAPAWITENEIMGIPKRTLMIGGALFAVGLVTLSVLRG